jgi:two-component system phosphate regulon response regulator PhoB
MSNYRIMVCEDDQAIATSLMEALADAGYGCVRAPNGQTALTELGIDGGQAGPPVHLVLLDVRLGPGPDGFAVCRQIREAGLRVPVIMVTARDEEIDRILGLEIGADDYVIKPFRLRELLSRIRAQLRRAWGPLSAAAEPPAASSDRHYQFGTCRFDTQTMRLYRDNIDVGLTPVELRMLRYFIENNDQVLSRRQIINVVWGDGWVLEDERAVDVHIRHVREKIETDPASPQFIKTVRGFGYRFEY